MTLASDARFAGLAALVTGGSRGIGFAVARQLIDEGARVTITGRDVGSLTAAQLRLGTTCHICCGDAGDTEHAQRSVESSLKHWGRLDILVNNVAHVPPNAGLLEIPLEQLDLAYHFNLRAPLVWVRAAWAAALGTQGGSIVNIATLGALALHPGMGAYGATKAALIHLTRYLAAECGPRVRVNAVAPGLIRTEQSRSAWDGAETRIAAGLPAARLGEASDVAAAVAFLADPRNSWVTGETLVVDGGTLVQSGRRRSGR